MQGPADERADHNMQGDEDERADTTIGVKFGPLLPQELVDFLLAKLRELHSNRDCAGIATWNPRLGLHTKKMKTAKFFFELLDVLFVSTHHR